MKFYALIIAFGMITTDAFTQNADSSCLNGIRTLHERASQTQNTALLIYDNPATQTMRFRNSLSQVSFGFESKRETKPFVAQIGNGKRAFLFDASSYVRMNANSVVWSSACYENGRRLNPIWNENSEYEKLYPYVTGDSVSADMKREAYVFNAGYACQASKIGFGAEMSYRSSLEYRDKDPRPRNTSLEVSARAGISYKVLGNHSLGIYADVQKYSQQSSIAFMNPYGKLILYHLTGLGMQYFRFKGDDDGVKYEGNSFGGGITWHSLNGEGLQAMLSSRREHIQKMLTERHYLPLCDTYQQDYKAEISWLKNFASHSLRIVLDADKKEREGKERIYDDGTTNYHEITSSKPFNNNIYDISLYALGEYRMNENLTAELQPSVAYHYSKMTYANPYREMKTAHLRPSIDFRMSCITGKSLVSGGLSAGYTANTSKNLLLNNPEIFAMTIAVERQNYEMQTSNHTDLGIFARYDFSIDNMVNSIFLKAEYNCRIYSNNEKITHYTLSLGVTI